ncbi:MAG: hypothetical protein HN377_01600 [Alphaproteobacteria bacterium]|nr:hypothetical protein [Alphaproteobacteria bacterium]MBT7941999.1 hypothetical protein [Alphaproteobacteria bacterium]
MPYSLILDLLVAVLLVVTIGFAVILNKRLGKLRGERRSLEKLAATFGESTVRAEEGIKILLHTTEVLQQRLDQAQALKDDLAFLIERGDRAADNLENLVRATRDTGTAESKAKPDSQPGRQPQPDPAPAAGEGEPLRATRDFEQPVDQPDDEDDGKSEAERELLKAIRSAG